VYVWKHAFSQSDKDLRSAFELASQAEQAHNEHNIGLAISLYEECLAEFRRQQRWDWSFQVRIRLGYFYMELQEFMNAREHFAQAVSLARNLGMTNEKASAMICLAHLASLMGDCPLAERIGTECLQVFNANNDVPSMAYTHVVLGSSAPTSAEAANHFTESLSLSEKVSYEEGIIAALCSLGHLAEAGKDNVYERECLDRCLRLCAKSSSEHNRTRAYILNNIGNIERFAGNTDRAMELYRESLRIKQELGDAWAITYTLEGCAATLVSKGECAQAARLYGAAASIRERLGTPLERSKLAANQADLEAARRLIGEAAFETAWHEGGLLSDAEAVLEAIAV
jgi:tetratricopeptide (TPR) repeat protein